MKLSIIIPVYNEIKTIEKLINKIIKLKIKKQLIVVDDGSKGFRTRPRPRRGTRKSTVGLKVMLASFYAVKGDTQPESWEIVGALL